MVKKQLSKFNKNTYISRIITLMLIIAFGIFITAAGSPTLIYATTPTSNALDELDDRGETESTAGIT